MEENMQDLRQEWEEKLKNGKIVEINGKKYFKPFRGYTVTLNYFIHSLLKAKDQEADRRVEEVIGEIEEILTKEAHTRNIKVGTSIFGFYYAIRSDIEALKNKLSPKV